MYKVLVFGTGNGCKEVNLLLDLNKCNVVGYLDNNEKKYGCYFMDKIVINPKDISKYDYDFIVIANSFCDDIINQLLSYNVPREKIIAPFLKSSKKTFDLINREFDNYNKISKNKIDKLCLCNMGVLGREREIDENFFFQDFVRISSIELAANQINSNNISGNVAELGVYRGDFSSIINMLFKERKLYLFDTFDGFDERDIMIDETNKYSKSSKQDFSNTSIDTVLCKMKYSNQCVIKKGYFPESLDGLEDKFAFVSIDADLYKPTYDGLIYFYPRMVKGAYIFIHDYNNLIYPGVKKAVDKFCAENDISIFPLSDYCGTAVIIKQ